MPTELKDEVQEELKGQQWHGSVQRDPLKRETGSIFCCFVSWRDLKGFPNQNCDLREFSNCSGQRRDSTSNKTSRATHLTPSEHQETEQGLLQTSLTGQ